MKDVSDLYRIKITDICGYDRSREKSARKIINAIEASKEVPFDRVLFALGIRFVGRVAARQIAQHFRSMERLKTVSAEDLLEVEGIGAVIANSVVSFLSNPTNSALIDRLAEAGVKMELPETVKASDKLAGKSIVISGTFARHSREEYKEIIEQHGGKNVSSISKKTSFVFAGENMGPSKLEKATKLGVPIVNEEEFLSMIGEG